LRWFPVTANGQPDPEDLLSLLALSDTTLRPATENVNGFDCAVIDRFDNEGNIRTTLWLARNRGHLPIYQESRDNGSEEISVTWNVTDFLALPNGAFLPLYGERIVGARGDEELSEGLRYSFEIASDGQGAPVVNLAPL